jgi:hypothetical protein
MGLFITKALVERHGGTLQIDSHPGKGTTVRITLPTERLLPSSQGVGISNADPYPHFTCLVKMLIQKIDF